MTQSNVKISLFAFLSAFFFSIFVALIPIYYTNAGFNNAQIGILTSLLSLGAIIQPIFIMAVNGKFSFNSLLITNLVIVFFCFIGLFFANSFAIVFLIILIYAIFNAPIAPLVDMIIAKYSEKTGTNFGKIRRFISLSWGISVLLISPFLYVIGFNVFLIIIALSIIILIIIFVSLIKESDILKNNASTKLKIRNIPRKFVLYSIFVAFFMGAWNLKGTYQSLLVYEVSGSEFYISIICFTSTFIEILILPYFYNLRDKFGSNKLFIFTLIVACIQLVIYAVADTILIVIIASCLHGIVNGIFIPNSIFTINKFFKGGSSENGMILSASLTSMFGFVFSLFIVTPIFASYGLEAVFLSLTTLMAIAIIPFIILNYEKKIW